MNKIDLNEFKVEDDLMKKMMIVNEIIIKYAKIKNWDYGKFCGEKGKSNWNDLLDKWELSYTLTSKSKLKYKLFNSFEELFSELIKITYNKSKKNYMKMLKEIPSIVHHHMGLLDKSNVRNEQLLRGLPLMNYKVKPKEIIYMK